MTTKLQAQQRQQQMTRTTNDDDVGLRQEGPGNATGISWANGMFFLVI
jgi:hypothetical protein